MVEQQQHSVVSLDSIQWGEEEAAILEDFGDHCCEYGDPLCESGNGIDLMERAEKIRERLDDEDDDMRIERLLTMS